ncbi:hypothetical protein ABZ368_05170 [Streptomyces sp. NPDC005908]|uniref:hypothetical protein n=1 Tax=Streptomyces sp. NPDC005908 TaxID=3157084 RepID=UPI0033D594C5
MARPAPHAPGSEAAIMFGGEGLTTAEPGQAQGPYLIVTEIEAARAELLECGTPVSDGSAPRA